MEMQHEVNSTCSQIQIHMQHVFNAAELEILSALLPDLEGEVGGWGGCIGENGGDGVRDENVQIDEQRREYSRQLGWRDVDMWRLAFHEGTVIGNSNENESIDPFQHPPPQLQLQPQPQPQPQRETETPNASLEVEGYKWISGSEHLHGPQMQSRRLPQHPPLSLPVPNTHSTFYQHNQIHPRSQHPVPLSPPLNPNTPFNLFTMSSSPETHQFHTRTPAPNPPNTSTSTSASPPSYDEKRASNTAASARFRAKKKKQEEILEQTTREKRLLVERLEKRIEELEVENEWLRGLILERDEARRGKGVA